MNLTAPLPCPVGSFCPTPLLKQECVLGFHCPENTYVPKLCTSLVQNLAQLEGYTRGYAMLCQHKH